MASPSDHNAAPSRTTSFIKNCPTAPERAGNPPRRGSHPGVENKNESVVRNIRTATALPIVHALADQCRRLIKHAIHNSTMQCQTITEYQHSCCLYSDQHSSPRISDEHYRNSPNCFRSRVEVASNDVTTGN